MRETDLRPHYVYFITPCRGTSGKAGAVKIGFSSDPDRRLREIQAGNPVPLKIAISLTFDCRRKAEVVERCMHRLGKKKHRALHGEWFYIYGSWPKFIDQSIRMAEGALKTSLGSTVSMADVERLASERLDLIALSSSPI